MRYHKNFIFVIRKVDLVEIDVYTVENDVCQILLFGKLWLWRPLAAKPLTFHTYSYDDLWSPTQYLSNELSLASIRLIWKTSFAPSSGLTKSWTPYTLWQKFPCPFTCVFCEFYHNRLGAGVNQIFLWFFDYHRDNIF